MKKRNLSAKKKIHNFFLSKIKIPKVRKVYLEFKNKVEKYSVKNLCIATSGGSDSMALVFLSKCYSIEKNIKCYYFIVDHGLRKESAKEAKIIKNKLKKFDINSQILTWNKKKFLSNIQSRARDKRYGLIFDECLKKKINLVLTAHHKDDLIENFFIRLLRGSGLKGLSSFNNIKTRIIKEKNIHILRPLLNFSKKDLKYITTSTFDFYIEDPSNSNDYFLRVKIRKLINGLNQDGLYFNKFIKTIRNLDQSNHTVEFYVKKNVQKNSKYLNNKKSIILNDDFFYQPNEIVFRSLSEVIHKFGIKDQYTRGSKVINLLKHLNSLENTKQITLSGCLFKKVSKSIIISREN